MELYEYNQLAVDEQAQLMLTEGTALANRSEGEYNIILYALYNFYVEAWYVSKPVKFHHLRTFKNLSQLEVYLDDLILNLDNFPNNEEPF